MQKLTQLKIINYLSILLVALQLFYPLKALFPNYFQVPVFLAWIVLCGVYRKEFIIEIFKKNYILIALVIVTFIRVILANRIEIDFYSPFLILIGLYQLFVFYSVFLFYKDNIFFRLKLVRTSFIFIDITCLLSLLYLLFCDRYAVRYAMQLEYFGVADFELVYTAALLVGILTYYFTKKKWTEIIDNQLYFYTLIISFVFVILSNLLTAVLLMLVFMFLAYYFKKRYSFKMLLISLFVTIFLIWTFRNGISSLLVEFTKFNLVNDVINYKILGIANFLIGEGDTFGITLRLELIMRSISSFLDNPVFGLDYVKYNVFTLGLHCEWFDDLARFGVVGCCMLLYSYQSVYREIKNSLIQDKILVTYKWIFFIILGFFNPNMMASLYFGIIFFSTININDHILDEYLSEFENINYTNTHLNISSDLLLGNNDKKGKITIVIPTYRRNELLVEAVKSAINQIDTNIDYKILIIDNDPNDNKNLTMLKSLNNEKLIYYRNQENLGMFGNINRGVFLANSEYVSLLHDDDILLENYLSIISNNINKYDCIVPKARVIGNQKILNSFKLNKLEKFIKFLAFPQRLLYVLHRKNNRTFKLEYTYFSRRNIYGPPSCGFLFKKNIWNEMNGFNEDFHPSSDFLFMLMLNKKYKILKTNQIVAAYRWEDNESLNLDTQIEFARKALIIYKDVPTINYKIELEKYINEIEYSIVYKYPNNFRNIIKNNKRRKIKYYFYQFKRLYYFYSHCLDDFLNY